MRPLSVEDLLTVWELGLERRPYERALTLLSAAEGVESSQEALADLSIGSRDARLLSLREWAFGSRLEIVAACPQCEEELEIDTSVPALRACDEPVNRGAGEVSASGYEVRFRSPSTTDLIACENADPATARDKLLERCVLDARCEGEPIGPGDLPADVIEVVSARMALDDPQAETRIALHCPNCSHEWDEDFDIVAFFWAEIDGWARRLLRDVHVLATAYGWHERDILSLTPGRRQIYLAMAQS